MSRFNGDWAIQELITAGYDYVVIVVTYCYGYKKIGICYDRWVVIHADRRVSYIDCEDMYFLKQLPSRTDDYKPYASFLIRKKKEKHLTLV